MGHQLDLFPEHERRLALDATRRPSRREEASAFGGSGALAECRRCLFLGRDAAGEPCCSWAAVGSIGGTPACEHCLRGR